VEQVFSLPPLKTVQNSSELSDLFKAGAYP
jgi:hypothetical protein